MDTIYREQVIQAIDDYTKGKPLYDYPWQIIEVIKSIPSAEKTGKWIPCKERLPKLGEDVWVTVDGKSKIAHLEERKTTFGHWIREWETDDAWICQFEEVIAWQPLYKPHPYNCGVGMNQ